MDNQPRKSRTSYTMTLTNLTGTDVVIEIRGVDIPINLSNFAQSARECCQSGGALKVESFDITGFFIKDFGVELS